MVGKEGGGQLGSGSLRPSGRIARPIGFVVHTITTSPLSKQNPVDKGQRTGAVRAGRMGGSGRPWCWGHMQTKIASEVSSEVRSRVDSRRENSLQRFRRRDLGPPVD